MGAMPQIAEFVNDGIFQDGLGSENQVPVQVHYPVESAASPQVLLILDLNPGGLEAVGLAMLPDEDHDILPEPLP